MQLEIIVIASAGIASFLLVWAVAQMASMIFGQQETKMSSRIKRISGAPDRSAESVVRLEMMSSILWLNSLLTWIAPVRKLKKLITQSGLNVTPGVVVLASLTSALFAFLLLRTFGVITWVTGAVGFLCLPLLVVNFLKRKRMNQFVNQLPDALDSLARALQSGHALTSGLKLIATDFPAPLGQEFSILLQEVNYGISMNTALMNLSERVDVQDLRFFVTALRVQRDTGGNLAEIVETIAYLIRERFKLEGKIKVLTAECRISAVVLILLPIALGIFLHIFNPKYLELLYTTEQGLNMVKGASVSMVVGLLVIRKMIKVRV